MWVECHAPADALCRAVYDCGCSEWETAGIDDGAPWHEASAYGGSERVRHPGWFENGACNPGTWVNEQGARSSQASGPAGRVEFPIECEWTGDGVEWRPSGAAS